MIGGIDGRGLSIPRGGPIPPRGERYPGIHAIEVYVPRHCVQADALEMEHDCKGKYTDGLQMQQWGACDEDEDVVSMARTAVRRLVEKQGLAWEDIGMLNVGTESLLDRSKSIKSHLMDLFPPDVVTVEARDPSPSRILAPLQTPNPVPWPQTPPDPRAQPPPRAVRRRGRRLLPRLLRRHRLALRVHELGRLRRVGRPVGHRRVHRRLRRAAAGWEP